MIRSSSVLPFSSNTAHPRLGFLGTGWIGRHRMEAIAKSGFAEIVALADANMDAAREAKAQFAPEALIAHSLNELLEAELDGVVIATPSALHAEQSITALNHGLAVFCQKPLARNASETGEVVAAAERANRLLGVDLSYRHITGVSELRALIQNGELGRVFAADLVFHNAYGPDKEWFYNRTLSGGGCLIDLGVHLIDLALWTLGFPAVVEAHGRLFAQGAPLEANSNRVEDFASAQIELAGGTHLSLSCSWKLHAGCEAVIEATFYGTEGAVRLCNTNGSFYDFSVERLRGTSVETTAAPDMAWTWGGRAAVKWVERLCIDKGYDASAEEFIRASETLDRIYAASVR